MGWRLSWRLRACRLLALATCAVSADDRVLGRHCDIWGKNCADAAFASTSAYEAAVVWPRCRNCVVQSAATAMQRVAPRCTIRGCRADDGSFRFDNSLGNHMVLQRAPARAAVYGNVQEGTLVTVTFDGKMYCVHHTTTRCNAVRPVAIASRYNTTGFNKDGVGRWKVPDRKSVDSKPMIQIVPTSFASVPRTRAPVCAGTLVQMHTHGMRAGARTTRARAHARRGHARTRTLRTQTGDAR
jgi:hypothetical protein